MEINQMWKRLYAILQLSSTWCARFLKELIYTEFIDVSDLALFDNLTLQFLQPENKDCMKLQQTDLRPAPLQFENLR